MAANANDGDDTNPSSEDNSEEQTEITDVEENDVEVVDAGMPESSKKVQRLTAYADNVGNRITYRILPQITREGASWVAVFYLDGAQGPVLQTQNVTEEQAVDLGLSKRQRQQINSLLAQANEELEVPKSLRGQQMDTQPVSMLEDVLEG